MGRAGFEPGQRFRAPDLQSGGIRSLLLDGAVAANDTLVNSPESPDFPGHLIHKLRF